MKLRSSVPEKKVLNFQHILKIGISPFFSKFLFKNLAIINLCPYSTLNYWKKNRKNDVLSPGYLFIRMIPIDSVWVNLGCKLKWCIWSLLISQKHCQTKFRILSHSMNTKIAGQFSRKMQDLDIVWRWVTGKISLMLEYPLLKIRELRSVYKILNKSDNTEHLIRKPMQDIFVVINKKLTFHFANF